MVTTIPAMISLISMITWVGRAILVLIVRRNRSGYYTRDREDWGSVTRHDATQVLVISLLI